MILSLICLPTLSENGRETKQKKKDPFARPRRGYRGERDKDGHPWEGQLFDHWGGNGVDQVKIRVRGGYILKVESKQFGT